MEEPRTITPREIEDRIYEIRRQCLELLMSPEAKEWWDDATAPRDTASLGGETMPFGKHEGIPLSMMITKYRSYINWFLDQPWAEEGWPDLFRDVNELIAERRRIVNA